ncbi:Trm112 family protein [Embleya sp. NBC_00896]|uniref:Trm112 family protein n=1 Tax=Embleya sp. NBC_00896 TaxID=2975961 RepID=UPI00386723C5|nr:Trm112 family protein [Embleya sp. NBC_00896]
MNLEPSQLAILTCPVCHTSLRREGDTALACENQSCGLVYPVVDDIPVLLVDEARRPGAARA